MEFVQPLITTDQALMTSLAIKLVLEDPDRFVMSGEESDQYAKLEEFFKLVAQYPRQFRPTGRNAAAVKTIVRKAKGPSQPSSGANKRKRTQARRQSFSKRSRAEKREYAKQYSEALEKYLADAEEAQAAQAELVAKLDAEPKLELIDVAGNVVLSDIPESLIRPVVQESKVVLPAGVEA